MIPEDVVGEVCSPLLTNLRDGATIFGELSLMPEKLLSGRQIRAGVSAWQPTSFVKCFYEASCKEQPIYLPIEAISHHNVSLRKFR